MQVVKKVEPKFKGMNKIPVKCRKIKNYKMIINRHYKNIHLVRAPDTI